MSNDHGSDTSTRDWQGDWEGNEQAELRSWLKATPAERLSWLEEAIRRAHEAGALPSREEKQGSKHRP